MKEEAKKKILKCIESCKNVSQLFSTLSMINNFVKLYTCQLSREKLSSAYREKYNEFS